MLSKQVTLASVGVMVCRVLVAGLFCHMCGSRQKNLKLSEKNDLLYKSEVSECWLVVAFCDGLRALAGFGFGVNLESFLGHTWKAV